MRVGRRLRFLRCLLNTPQIHADDSERDHCHADDINFGKGTVQQGHGQDSDENDGYAAPYCIGNTEIQYLQCLAEEEESKEIGDQTYGRSP